MDGVITRSGESTTDYADDTDEMEAKDAAAFGRRSPFVKSV